MSNTDSCLFFSGEFIYPTCSMAPILDADSNIFPSSITVYPIELNTALLTLSYLAGGMLIFTRSLSLSP